MYVDIVISNVFNLNKFLFFFYFTASAKFCSSFREALFLKTFYCDFHKYFQLNNTSAFFKQLFPIYNSIFHKNSFSSVQSYLTVASDALLRIPMLWLLVVTFNLTSYVFVPCFLMVFCPVNEYLQCHTPVSLLRCRGWLRYQN